MPGDVSWLDAAVLASVALAAGAQVLSGMGFALVAGPLLILALGHGEGVRVSVALSLVLNVVLLINSYRLVRWGDALRLLVPAALLVLPALALTTHLGGAWTAVIAGVAILIGVALIALGHRAHWVDGPAGAIAAGASSGVLNVLAGTSGPPVALFVAHRNWAPKVSTATLQAYALPLNLLTLAAIGLPTAHASRLLWAGLGLLLGAGIGWPFVDRISAAAVRTMVLTLATLGALLLIGRALA